MSRRLIRSGAMAAFGAAFLLVVQFALGLGIGSDIALLSQTVDAARMTAFFEMHARALTQLMAADDAFAIAYAVAFVALAFYLMPRGKLLALTALTFALMTALFDLAENSLTLAAVAAATQNQALDANVFVILFWLGQIKFLAIYVSAILFAVGVWEDGRAGKIFAALLLFFPLIGILGIPFEPFVLAKILWMLVLLVAGGIFMWRAPQT